MINTTKARYSLDFNSGINPDIQGYWMSPFYEAGSSGFVYTWQKDATTKATAAGNNATFEYRANNDKSTATAWGSTIQGLNGRYIQIRAKLTKNEIASAPTVSSIVVTSDVVGKESSINHVINGGFDSGITGWGASNGGSANGTVSHVTNDGISKPGCLEYSVSNNGSYVYFSRSINNMTIDVTKQYTVSFWAKISAGTQSNLALRISDGDTLNEVMGTRSFTVTSSWQRFTATFTPSSVGNAKLLYFAYVTTSNGTTCSVRIDDVKLEERTYVTPYSEYGADRAVAKSIRIEEGTTNLTTANASSIETDATGWSSTGSPASVVSRDTTEKWEGAASLKVVCDGAAGGQGASSVYLTSTAGTYTLSVHIKGAGNINIWQRHRYTDNTYDELGTTAFNTTNEWKRYAVTATTPSNGKTLQQVELMVRTNGAQVVTFYMDGIQLEQKAYATSWVKGGETRIKEVVNIPVGTLNLAAGTIITRIYVTKEMIANPAPSHFTVFDSRKIGGSYNQGIYLGRSNGNNNWHFFAVAGGAYTSQNWVNTLAEGWHTFGIRYNSSEMSLWIDGVKRAFISTPNLPTESHSMKLGSDVDSNYQLDSVMDEINIFTEALTDSEMATLTVN